MKKKLLAVALAGVTGAFASPVLAADPKAPEPDFTITGNFGLVTDYRFRGVTQTFEKPAIQGGFDFTHKSGAYLGTWASNVGEWANYGGSMEIDFYGGYRGTLLAADVGFDVGLIEYTYPGNTANPKNRTQEWYAGLSKGPFSYKFYRTTGNWFGIARSSGSTYHDLNASLGLNEQVTLSLHAGKQDIAGNAQAVNPDFTDYSVGVSVALPDSYTVGLKFTTVDFKDSRANSRTVSGAWFNTQTGTYSTANSNKDLAKDAIVLSLTKTF